MADLQVFTTEDHVRWQEIVERSAQHDFYHLPQYHAVAESQGEGSAHLFHYSEGEFSIALPLLLRPLNDMPLCEPGWKDATSVYGYAGPVCSHAAIPPAVAANFRMELAARLRDMKVVSVFSRLHPFLRQAELLEGLGQCQARSQTVSIDLTLPVEAQRTFFRRAHREALNRIRRHGVRCNHDSGRTELLEFVRIYHETMHRVRAVEGYFFPLAYFEELCDGLGSRVHFFCCKHEGRSIAAGLFVACDGILQYHLGGTADDAIKLAPAKLFLDEARLWGTAQGLRVFHLGGGATSRPDDSLLHFKQGFSDRLHDFCVWQCVLFPEVYHRLCRQKAEWNESQRVQPSSAGYFPEYRSPIVPCLIASKHAATRAEAMA